MLSQKFNKNVNWNIEDIFFKLTYKLYGCIWLNKIVTFKKILTLHSVEVSSSPNSPPLFVIVFCGEANRSSLSQIFFKTAVLKNFVGKHQCWSISWTPAMLLKRDSNTVFSCEICEILKKKTQEISVVHCVAKLCSDHLAQVLSLLSNIRLNLLTKSNFTFKLYCGLLISYVIMWLTLFTWILKNDWFKKKTTFVRRGKVEMISAFQWNRHLRKLSVSKTFTHVQEQKTRCHRDIPLTFRLV